VRSGDVNKVERAFDRGGRSLDDKCAHGRTISLRPGPRKATTCALLEGDALAAVLPALQQSNALTGWKSGGDTWALRLRPMSPGESGCAEPATRR
jgi:hypothetical protein